MSLTEKMKRELRARGHTLKPVVSIGNAGLSTAVLREIELSLEHHELMKIRIGGADREQRKADHREICEQLRCRTGAGHRPHRTHLPANAASKPPQPAACPNDALMKPRPG